MGPLICLENVNSSFSVSSADTPTNSTSFPASHALDYTHPLRQYRANNDTANGNQIILQNSSGSSVTIGAIFVDNINFDKVGFDLPGASFDTVLDSAVDGRTGRRKVLAVFNGGVTVAASQTVAIEVGSGGSSVDGSGEAHIGAISLWTESGKYRWPGGEYQGATWTITIPRVSNAFEGGLEEPITIGEPYVSLSTPTISFIHGLTDDGQTDTQSNILYKLARQSTKPVLYYENNGNLEKAYVMRLASGSTSTSDLLTDKLTEGSFSFNEVV